MSHTFTGIVTGNLPGLSVNVINHEEQYRRPRP